jgi:predicted secreted protein
MIRKLSLAILTCLACATASEAATTYETYFNESGSGEAHEASVGFSESCGEECHVASLSCKADSEIRFLYAGFEAKLAAAIIAKDKRDFTVKAGSSSFTFSVRWIEYEGEMTGDWSMDGELSGEAKDFTAALSKAKNFKATIGSKSVTLPVTKDVLSWAKACTK